MLAPQIFQNLISNAIKYRAPDRTAAITISTQQKDRGIDLSIRDNGQGFDAQYAHQIFEPFRRLEPPSDKNSGTGIGLAIVQKLSHRHGWSVRAESQLGQGSCFTLTIPQATSTLSRTDVDAKA